MAVPHDPRHGQKPHEGKLDEQKGIQSPGSGYVAAEQGVDGTL